MSRTTIQQDVTEHLCTDGAGEYTYSAFVRTELGIMPIYVGLKIVDYDGTHYHPAPGVEANPNKWQTTKRTHNVTWRNLIEAYIYVKPTWGRTGTYFVDDCSLAKGKETVQ